MLSERVLRGALFSEGKASHKLLGQSFNKVCCATRVIMPSTPYSCVSLLSFKNVVVETLQHYCGAWHQRNVSASSYPLVNHCALAIGLEPVRQRVREDLDELDV